MNFPERYHLSTLLKSVLSKTFNIHLKHDQIQHISKHSSYKICWSLALQSRLACLWATVQNWWKDFCTFPTFLRQQIKGKSLLLLGKAANLLNNEKLEKGIKLKLWVKDVNLAKIFKTYDSRVCFTNKQWTSSNFVEHPIKMKIFLKLQWKSNHEQCLGSELSCKKLQNLLCHGGRACWEIS